MRGKKAGSEDPPTVSGGGVAICQRWVFVSATCLCWLWRRRRRFEPRVSAHVCGVNTLLLLLLLMLFFSPPPPSSSPSSFPAAAFFLFFLNLPRVSTLKQAVRQSVGGSGWRAGWLPYLSPAHWLTQYAPILTLLASRLACPTT